MTLSLDLQSVLDPRRVFLAPVKFLPQVFFHMILRHQRYQRKPTHMIFTLRTSTMHFLPKPDFEGYRNNAKKQFEQNQNYVGDEEFHQELDHPSTFMKMVKERTRTMSAVNDERLQVIPTKSSGMEPLTVLKYLETKLKFNMDKWVLAIYLIHVSRKPI
jgi:hypothetical protein